MRFQIEFTPSSEKDIEYFKKHEQKIILAGIRKYLSEDANVETKRKKQLRPNPFAPWELRIGDYRIFYDFEEKDSVKITAIGFKIHHELFIRGKRVEI